MLHNFQKYIAKGPGIATTLRRRVYPPQEGKQGFISLRFMRALLLLAFPYMWDCKSPGGVPYVRDCL